MFTQKPYLLSICFSIKFKIKFNQMDIYLGESVTNMFECWAVLLCFEKQKNDK